LAYHGDSACLLPAEPALITIDVRNHSPDWADRLARFTRNAYRDSDPLPGLPVPDGAVEDAGALHRFIDGGGAVHLAMACGAVIAGLRTSRAADGTWWISRVATLPDRRSSGLASRMLAAAERAARLAGARLVCLDAVVERCLVPFYARVGYRVLAYHPPADGKPLTEATMARDPAAPRLPAPSPVLDHPVRVRGARVTLGWFLTWAGMAAVVVSGPAGPATVRAGAALLGDPHARLAGVDAWRGSRTDLSALLAESPGARPHPGGAVVRFPDRRRADVPLHVLPRSEHPWLWAVNRFRPGREQHPTAPHPDSGKELRR
jgi:GNAT superfamily N-acetyltransferase